MTARRMPIGTRVLAWAERHVDAEALDTLVQPAVADLQHEHAASGGRPSIVRWAVCLRGYVAVGEVLGLHLVHRGVAGANGRRVAAPSVAPSNSARSGIMGESTRNSLLMVAAGVLVAAVGFAAGRASTRPAPRWSPADAPVARSFDESDAYRALQRTVDDQRREAADRDQRLRQELEQQRYDAEIARVTAERARIDAETEFASQQTQQLIEQRRQAAELETAKLESARRDAYLELARQRTQLMLEELGRKR